MKKTLSTLALSLFALVGVAQAADITVEKCRWKAGCATKSTACHCA